MTTLPYRPNVGAVLFNASGKVFVARRADIPNAEALAGAWQLPQGGIDAGEDPRVAVLRELEEEIGTARAEIVGEHDAWLTYDLPAELIGTALRGQYRGQRQRWFALRFTGHDSDVSPFRRHICGRDRTCDLFHGIDGGPERDSALGLPPGKDRRRNKCPSYMVKTRHLFLRGS